MTLGAERDGESTVASRIALVMGRTSGLKGRDGSLVAPVQQPQPSQHTGMFLRVGMVVSYLWIQDAP